MATSLGNLSVGLDLSDFMRKAEQAEARLRQMDAAQHAVKLTATLDTSAVQQAERALTAAQVAASNERIAAAKNESNQRVADNRAMAQALVAAERAASQERIAADRVATQGIAALEKAAAQERVATTRAAAQSETATIRAAANEHIAAAKNASTQVAAAAALASREQIASAKNTTAQVVAAERNANTQSVAALKAASQERQAIAANESRERIAAANNAARAERDSANNAARASRSNAAPSFGERVASSAIGNYVGNLASNVTTQAVALIGRATGAVFEYAGALDKARGSYEAAFGSTALAEQFTRRLQTYANQTAANFADTNKAAQQYLSNGLNPNQTIATVANVNNIVRARGGGREEVDGVNTALNQVIAKQRLYAEEGQQFAERGVNIYAILARVSGESVAQVRARGEAEGISYNEVLRSLQVYGQLPEVVEAAARQARTLPGALESIKDSGLSALADIFAPALEGLREFAVNVAAFMRTPMFDAFVKNAQAAVAGAVATFKVFLNFLSPIGDILGKIFGFDPAQLQAQIKAALDVKPDIPVPNFGSEWPEVAQIKTEMKGYEATIEAANEKIRQHNKELQGTNDLLLKNKQAQDAVRDQYQPRMDAIQRQITVANMPSQAEMSRANELGAIGVAKLKIEAEKPSTASLEKIVSDTTRELRDMADKKYTADLGFAAEGKSLEARMHALSLENTDREQAAVDAVKSQLEGVNKAAEIETRRLDLLSRGVKKEMDAADKIATGKIRGFDAQIDALRDRMAAVDKVAAGQVKSLDRQTTVLRDKSEAVSTLAASQTAALDKQMQGVRREMDGIGKDRTLERRIEDLQRTVGAPELDTSGFSNSLVALRSQAAGGVNVDAQFGATSRAMQGAIAADRAKRAAAKTELEQLQERQVIQKRMDEDHRDELQQALDKLDAQKTSIADAAKLVTDGYAAQIKGLEGQKTAIQDAAAAVREQQQAALDGLERQKKGVQEAATLERERQQAILDGYAEQKQLLDDTVYLVRERLDGELKGAQATLDAATKSLATRRAGLAEEQYQLGLRKAASDEEYAAATRVVQLRQRGAQDGIQAINDETKALLEPLNRREAILRYEQGIADEERRRTVAPLKTEYDTLNLAMMDGLKPLELKRQELERTQAIQQHNLDLAQREKADAEAALELAKKRLKVIQDSPYQPFQYGPDSPLAGPPAPSWAMNGGGGPPKIENGVTRFLDGVRGAIQDVLDSPQWKTLTSPDASAVQRIQAAYDLTLAKIDRRINESVTSDDWHVLLYGTHVGGKAATGGETWGALDRTLDEALTNFDRKLRQNNVPVTWGDWWERIKQTFGAGTIGSQDIYDELGNKLVDSTQITQDTTKRMWGTWGVEVGKTFSQFGTDMRTIFGGDGQQGTVGQSFSNTGAWARQIFGGDGQEGEVGATFRNTGTWAHTHFGEGGTVGQAFDALGRKAGEIFGTPGASGTGTLGMAFDAGKLSGGTLAKQLDDWFKPGGDVGRLFDGLGTKANDVFGKPDGPVQQAWADAGKALGTLKGDINTALFGEGGISGLFSTLGTNIGNAFSGVGGAIMGGLQGALNMLESFVNGIQGALNAVGGLFGNPTLGGTPWKAPQLVAPQAAGGGGGGARNEATGTRNFPGGPAFIGEAGRELYTVGDRTYLADSPTLLTLPAGSVVYNNAETERILNNPPPGSTPAQFAAGIAATGSLGDYGANIGRGAGPLDAIGGAWEGTKAAVGNFFSGVGSGAQSIVAKATDMLGSTLGALKMPELPGVLNGIGPAIADKIKSTVTDGVRGLLSPFAGNSSGGALGSGTGMDSLRGLIGMEARLHGIPVDLLAAIVMQESSGIVGRAEKGGFGRGLMQVDLGQNPNYDEKRLTGTTYDDARYQMESGIEILLRNKPKDWNNAAQVDEALYHYNGGRDYPGVIRGWMPRFASWKDDTATGAATGGIAPDGDKILAAALTTPGRYLWCEKFIMDTLHGIGKKYAQLPSAFAHSQVQGLSPGLGPKGAVVYFPYTDPELGNVGHVAFSGGDGRVYGTVSPEQTGWRTAAGYFPPPIGYTVNPAANGAYVTGGPAMILSNENPGNREGEITSPVPQMRAVVRDALRERDGGGSPTFVFQPGAIVVEPDGSVTVDPSRVRVERDSLAGLYGKARDTGRL